MKLFVLIISATTTALMAGLFFAWSCSVTLGLARLSNTGYISAMQSLNRAILNPLFFICFFGPIILLPLSTYMYFEPPASLRFWLLLGAALLYIIGVFGVSVFGNIPLNETLDSFHLSSASAEEIATQRAQFEGIWNKLNHIRTLASTLANLLVIIACINPEGWLEG